jgi:hypothetical protein
MQDLSLGLAQSGQPKAKMSKNILTLSQEDVKIDSNPKPKCSKIF